MQLTSNHQRIKKNCSDGFIEFRIMDFLSMKRKPSTFSSLNCVFPLQEKSPTLNTCKQSTILSLPETGFIPFIHTTLLFCNTWKWTTFLLPYKWKTMSYNLSTSCYKMTTLSLKKCIHWMMRSRFMSPLKNFRKNTLRPVSITKLQGIMTSWK